MTGRATKLHAYPFWNKGAALTSVRLSAGVLRALLVLAFIIPSGITHAQDSSPAPVPIPYEEGQIEDPAQSLRNAPRLEQIRIEGAQRVDPETIRSYARINTGAPITPQRLDRVLKSLFSTGLFADIQLRQRNGVLLINVVENPVVNRVVFEGNENIKDEELSAEIQIQPRSVFTRPRIQSDVERLHEIYRRNGRFSAQIEPKVIQKDQNRVDVIFEIEEGSVTKVQSITFVGNKAFGDDRLAKELSTKESRFYRFLTNADRYDPDRVNFDKELLRRFYLSQGYADFQVESAVAELSRNRSHFYLTFTVYEGPRYKVGDVAIQSALRNYDKAELRPLITFESGDWYDVTEAEESVDEIVQHLGEEQFAFVSVEPQISRNRESRTIDISFRIDETPKVFVERIEIEGNLRTLDEVIRREFTLVEGDPFVRSKLRRSEQNIKDLGYFENVSVETRPGSAPDKSVVDVGVSEKSTGELSFGAGFSTSDGVLFDTRLRERNFLGKGQDVLLGATLAGERSQFEFSFTEPYFLNRDLAAGFDVFHIRRDLQDESSFDQRKTGFALRFGYPLSKNLRQRLRYRVERNEIDEVAAGASRFIADQEGQRTVSSLSQRLTFDTRNSTRFPSEGYMWWLDTELAGLGGNTSFVKGEVGASWYYPFTQRVVLNILGEVGAVTGYSEDDVNINDRFFLGGRDIRGFEDSGLGPRDTASNDALGGNYFYRGSVELSFPLPVPEELGIEGHTFTDVGSLFEVDDQDPSVADEASPRVSAGIGLSWRSPFGPIRMDLAAPIVKEDFDEEQAFRFNFGTRF